MQPVRRENLSEGRTAAQSGNDGQKGVIEMTEAERVLTDIGPYRRRQLAVGALELTRRILAQPGGRELIEEEIKRMREQAQKGA